MIVEMNTGATKEQVDHVVDRAHSLGFEVQLNIGTEKTVVAILGSDTGKTDTDVFAVLPGVQSVSRVMKPYKLASREFHPRASKINVSGVEIGGQRIVIMAGPCAVESEKQLMDTARAVQKLGASVVRGGAFKPRTSPFSFQGLGQDALKMLLKVKNDLGIPVITEVVDIEGIEPVAKHADIIQVGARNMQNFALLRELSKLKHPILLKRGLSATVTEWLTAADYLLAQGNRRVILCERGIRTFEDTVRFSLDISSIPVIKQVSHLPVIVDPSHAAGHWAYVPSIAKAAIAAGADGILIEVHPKPEEALVDGLQSLDIPNFERLMKDLRPIAQAVGRYV
ncbi:MAG: 3-deoxy-7-phosphoheptulonate synthase [Dehalococcoidia bacterium]|nr:MAG: 3-deoxy-7-phosphoheptulonate synthase [Dehalococcoidia bacterium]